MRSVSSSSAARGRNPLFIEAWGGTGTEEEVRDESSKGRNPLFIEAWGGTEQQPYVLTISARSRNPLFIEAWGGTLIAHAVGLALKVVILSSSRHGAGRAGYPDVNETTGEGRNPLFIEAWGGTRRKCISANSLQKWS
tara:strand:+ start:6360 stop:6773 length:414 start_codon:yes stop_codon:yes gene_type:complete